RRPLSPRRRSAWRMLPATDRREPNLFTLPPGQPFLRTLASAVLSGDLPRPKGGRPGPLQLASTTILLPTPRAARALQEAFLDVSDVRALILPRIKPIADGEEDLSLLTAASESAPLDPTGADISPAIDEVERRIVLTRLVQQWSQMMR